MSALVSSVLADAEAEVRQRFSHPPDKANSTTSSSAARTSAATVLSLLTPEDWTAVLCPLAPETQCAPNAGLAELVRYVQLRCAELPMRLQMEALQVRRYERLLRQHTRELLTLSEYVALVSRTPPTLAATPHGGAATLGTKTDTSQSLLTDSAALPSDLSGFLAQEEVGQRLEHASERIFKLEVMLRQDAEAKVQCCQRMVLLSEYVRVLIRGVRRKAGEGAAVAGSKRVRSEKDKSE